MIAPLPDETIYLSFGQFIQKLLKDHGLKQADIVKRTDIDSGTLSRACTGNIQQQRKTRAVSPLQAAENLPRADL